MAVAADDDRDVRVAGGEQRRLVAEPPGRRAAAGGRDALGAARAAAVPAGDDGGPRAERGQLLDQPGDQGRLAGAADAEVADADAGHREAVRARAAPGRRPRPARGSPARAAPRPPAAPPGDRAGTGARVPDALEPGGEPADHGARLRPSRMSQRGAGDRFDRPRERRRDLEGAAAGGVARAAVGEQLPTALEERGGVGGQETAARGQQRPALVVDVAHVRPEDDRHAVIRRLEQVVPAGSPQVPPTQATSAAA